MLTNIPGKEKIAYKPSMTIKTTSEKTVQFHPLYKLTRKVVDMVPPGENRIKQFFSSYYFKGLFRGLPAKNLADATQLGYIDNNILVTLNTLFPENSILYLDNNPYVIVDVQWTSGDWRLKIEPPNVLTGPNYTKRGGGPVTLSYDIQIELQLFPGTTITPEQSKKLKCNSKYNSIWKHYSILTGSTYRPPVNYEYLTADKSREYVLNMQEEYLARTRKTEDEDIAKRIREEDDEIFRRRQQEDYDLRKRQLNSSQYYAMKTELENLRRNEDYELKKRRNDAREQLKKDRAQEDAAIKEEKRKKQEEINRAQKEKAQKEKTQQEKTQQEKTSVGGKTRKRVRIQKRRQKRRRYNSSRRR